MQPYWIASFDHVIWAKLKKMFVWHCLPRVSLGGSVGRHFIFFFNIYYLHMDGNGKKNKKSQIWKKIFFLVAKQVSRSAMPNKQFFIFGLVLLVHSNLFGSNHRSRRHYVTGTLLRPDHVLFFR